MATEVIFTKDAAKALVRMPANTAKLIRAKIDQYAKDPSSLANNVKALQGSSFVRLRVGEYRVVMLPGGTVLTIVRIATRGSVYD